MKNAVFTGAIVCLVNFLWLVPLQAQIKKPGFTVGISFIGAKPQGAFSSAYNLGAGGEAYAGLGWGNTFIIGTGGISVLGAVSSASGTLTYLPLKLGMRRFFLRKHLFVNADFGLASVSNKLMNDTHFTRGFGVGARLLGLEVALYYDGFKNKNASGFSNMLDAKAGLNFSL